MGRKDYWVLVLAVIFCLLVWNIPRQSLANSASRPTWEYKALMGSTLASYDNERLNELGAEGWELIATTENSSARHYFFKRMK